jgi:hypothetical protein
MTNHEKHIMMWDELAITGSGDKGSTKAHALYPTISACYACAEAKERGDCDDCPIDWGAEKCDECGSPFYEWAFAKTIKTRKKYAAIIRDLVWRER